jgi:hypothetical protein
MNRYRKSQKIKLNNDADDDDNNNNNNTESGE